MQKRRIGLIIGLSVVFVLGLGLWFWSLGSLSRPETQKATLLVEKGTVMAATKKSGFEAKAESGMELATGDKIKTGPGASAIVQAYGQGEIRLDENTSMTIGELQGGDRPLVMKFSLEAGRIWSGIMRLLDLDSRYEGDASYVVATVRGTSFALGKSSGLVELWIDHGGVAASASGKKNDFYVGGQWGSFTEGGQSQRGEAASSTWADDEWVKQNLEADKQFRISSTQKIQESLGADTGVLPDAWDYGLQLWSERMHLSVAGKDRPALWARYFARHLGQVQVLAMNGKSGLAYQRMSGLERELQTALDSKDGEKSREAVRPLIGRAMLGMSETAPGDVLFRFKLGLEDLYAKAWENDPANNFYARALAVDARLDEAERYDCEAREQDAVKEAVNAVEQGLAREKTDFGKISDGLTKERRTILEEKVTIQELRLKHFLEMLKTCEKAAQGSSTASGMTTSTTSTTETVSTTKVLTPTTTSQKLDIPTKPQAVTSTAVQPSKNILGLVRIELTIQPNPIEAGQRANLFVKGFKRDGTSMDVTPYASFQVLGSLGSISGSTYISSRPGSVTIQANVPDGSLTLSSTAAVTINQGVTLTSVTVRPASATVYPGKSIGFTAMATYSNGFTKDVTGDASWSLSNALGVMSGSTFIAGSTPGSTVVTGKYTDNGKTVYGEAAITVGSVGANTLNNNILN